MKKTFTIKTTLVWWAIALGVGGSGVFTLIQYADAKHDKLVRVETYKAHIETNKEFRKDIKDSLKRLEDHFMIGPTMGKPKKGE